MSSVSESTESKQRAVETPLKQGRPLRRIGHRFADVEIRRLPGERKPVEQPALPRRADNAGFVHTRTDDRACRQRFGFRLDGSRHGDSTDIVVTAPQAHAYRTTMRRKEKQQYR